MASSTNNTNIRLKPRMCDCARTTAMYIVRTNDNGNQGRLFFVCSSKYSNREHCNYFKFVDDDDEDITSTIRSNTGPLNAITTEEFNDLRTRVVEMELKHGRRIQRMEFFFKTLIYVIVFCIILYFMM